MAKMNRTPAGPQEAARDAEPEVTEAPETETKNTKAAEATEAAEARAPDPEPETLPESADPRVRLADQDAEEPPPERCIRVEVTADLADPISRALVPGVTLVEIKGGRIRGEAKRFIASVPVSRVAGLAAEIDAARASGGIPAKGAGALPVKAGR